MAAIVMEHPHQQHQYRPHEFVAAGNSPPAAAPSEAQADERKKLVTACISTKGQGVGDWTKKEVLGRGAFGIVWRGVLHSNGTNIAVKQIHTDGLGEGELKVSVI
jgi:serine/threonine protein kinase